MTLVDVHMKVPTEMAVYLQPSSQVMELERNALLLYPYILRQTNPMAVPQRYWEYKRMN